MRLEHKSLGVSVELLEDVRQRHVEAYFSALRDLGGATFFDQAMPRQLGDFVRAACRSEVLPEIREEDVDEMKPGIVAWIAEKLDSYLGKILEVPPE